MLIKYYSGVLVVILVVGTIFLGCGGDSNPTGTKQSESDPVTGSVNIKLTTLGEDIDDEYSLIIDGSENQNIGANETINVSSLEEGDHSLELREIKANCTVDGSNPINFSITGGKTTDVQISVSCKDVLDNAIVYYRNAEIYKMNPDGSSATNITNDDKSQIFPKVSPDGMYIAFTNYISDSESQIHVMRADGTEEKQLTNVAYSRNRAPIWSPDGSKIAFTSDRNDNFEVYIMNADGSNLKRITNNADFDFVTDWSKDGERLLFHSSRDGDLELYTINVEGKEVVKLTDSNTDTYFGYYSNDWGKIAYVQKKENGSDIWVMNADGTAAYQITNVSYANRNQPSWSPDDSEITYTGNDYGEFSDIYKINSDGSGSEINLTGTTGITEHSPDWSPVE